MWLWLLIGGLILLLAFGRELAGTVLGVIFGISVLTIFIWLMWKLIWSISKLLGLFSSSWERPVDVDEMTGIEFEKYAARYLRSQGFRTELTKATGDFGVDIIATKDGRSYAVQVKRQASRVSRRAVSDAVAGSIHYGCDEAMVITNSTFTKSAEEMAESTGCELVEI